MKAYVKPELFYEHFELSQHVAACTFDLNQGTGVCQGFTIPGLGSIFQVGGEEGACTEIVKDPDIYCYHANGVDPENGTLFNS